MRIRSQVVGLATLVTLGLGGAVASAAPAGKVDVCHREGNGSSHVINISTNAPVVFSNLTLNPAAAPIFPVPSPAPFGPDVRAFAEANGIIQRGVQDPRFNNQVPVAPDFHLPYAQQWSFGIQRQINRNNVFEVRYIGTHAVGLFQTVNVFVGDGDAAILVSAQCRIGERGWIEPESKEAA